MPVRLLSKNGRPLRRDSGEEIKIYSCPFSEFYENETMRNLSQKYDVKLHIGAVSSSLGSSEAEHAIANLFKTYQFAGGLCGVLESELETFTKQAGSEYDMPHLLPKEKPNEKDLFERALIEGNKVIFPTVKLLINQKVPLRKERYYLDIRQA